MQWSTKRKRKHKCKQIISRWFAWYPVKISKYDWVWLEFVWKEKYYEGKECKEYFITYSKDKPAIIDGCL